MEAIGILEELLRIKKINFGINSKEVRNRFYWQIRCNSLPDHANSYVRYAIYSLSITWKKRMSIVRWTCWRSRRSSARLTNLAWPWLLIIWRATTGALARCAQLSISYKKPSQLKLVYNDQRFRPTLTLIFALFCPSLISTSLPWTMPCQQLFYFRKCN